MLSRAAKPIANTLWQSDTKIGGWPPEFDDSNKLPCPNSTVRVPFLWIYPILFFLIDLFWIMNLFLKASILFWYSYFLSLNSSYLELSVTFISFSSPNANFNCSFYWKTISLILLSILSISSITPSTRYFLAIISYYKWLNFSTSFPSF